MKLDDAIGDLVDYCDALITYLESFEDVRGSIDVLDALEIAEIATRSGDIQNISTSQPARTSREHQSTVTTDKEPLGATNMLVAPIRPPEFSNIHPIPAKREKISIGNPPAVAARGFDNQDVIKSKTHQVNVAKAKVNKAVSARLLLLSHPAKSSAEDFIRTIKILKRNGEDSEAVSARAYFDAGKASKTLIRLDVAHKIGLKIDHDRGNLGTISHRSAFWSWASGKRLHHSATNPRYEELPGTQSFVGTADIRWIGLREFRTNQSIFLPRMLVQTRVLVVEELKYDVIFGNEDIRHLRLTEKAVRGQTLPIPPRPDKSMLS